jgi:hypothetical protein
MLHLDYVGVGHREREREGGGALQSSDFEYTRKDAWASAYNTVAVTPIRILFVCSDLWNKDGITPAVGHLLSHSRSCHVSFLFPSRP